MEEDLPKLNIDDLGNGRQGAEDMVVFTKEESKALPNNPDSQDQTEESHHPPPPKDRRIVEDHPPLIPLCGGTTTYDKVSNEIGSRADISNSVAESY